MAASGSGTMSESDAETSLVDKQRLVQVLNRRLSKWAQWRSDNWEPRWTKSYDRLHNKYVKEFGDEEGEDWRCKLFYSATRMKYRVARSLIFENVLNTGHLPFQCDPSPQDDSYDDPKGVSREVNGLLAADIEARTKRMKDRIRDQLVEAKMKKHMFTVVDSQAGLGTGVLRGPFVEYRMRNRWVPHIPEPIQQQAAAMMQAAQAAILDLQRQVDAGLAAQQITQEQADQAIEQSKAQTAQIKEQINRMFVENVEYKLEQFSAPSPAMTPVDLWDFYPDPESEDIHTGVGVFERTILSREELAALADEIDEDGNPIYDREAINDLLSGAPTWKNPQYAEDTQAGAGMYLDHRGPHREEYKVDSVKVFAVFTFAGKIAANDITDFQARVSGVQAAEGADEVSKYKTAEGIVVFCRDKILHVRKSPMRSGRRPYSSAPFSRIPGCPFGWGIPDEMDQPQSALNGFLRLFIDNKRLAGNVGSVVDRNRVENPDEKLVPGFRLEVKGGADVRSVYQAITIPDVGGNMLAALEFCERWANMASGIPAYLDGDQIKAKANTAFEANEMKTSALKQLGLPIQYLDEGVIIPLVEMLYDWNMEYCPDQSIKGDFSIAASGYSGFKDRIILGAELRNMLALAAQSPEIKAEFNVQGIVRRIAAASEVPEKDLLATPEQKAQAAKEASDAADAEYQRQIALQRDKIETEGRVKMDLLDKELELQRQTLGVRTEKVAHDIQKDAAKLKQDQEQFLIDQETKRKAIEAKTGQSVEGPGSAGAPAVAGSAFPPAMPRPVEPPVVLPQVLGTAPGTAPSGAPGVPGATPAPAGGVRTPLAETVPGQ